MKILYEARDGALLAAECTAIGAAQQPDDDRWRVRFVLADHDYWQDAFRDLTEEKAKRIVRRLFDVGVYIPDVHDV